MSQESFHIVRESVSKKVMWTTMMMPKHKNHYDRFLSKMVFLLIQCQHEVLSQSGFLRDQVRWQIKFMSITHWCDDILDIAPILLYSKRQNTCESYGSKLVAMHIAWDLISGFRIKLKSFGIPIQGPANTYGDNGAVIKNTDITELNKTHNLINDIGAMVLYIFTYRDSRTMRML